MNTKLEQYRIFNEAATTLSLFPKQPIISTSPNPLFHRQSTASRRNWMLSYLSDSLKVSF